MTPVVSHSVRADRHAVDRTCHVGRQFCDKIVLGGSVRGAALDIDHPTITVVR